MVLRHEEASRTALSGEFREGNEGHNHSEQGRKLGKTLHSFCFRYLQYFYITFIIDPCLYDAPTELDTSFALTQGGTEGSSAAEADVIDVENHDGMVIAGGSSYECAVSIMSTIEAQRYNQVLKRLKQEMPVPVSKTKHDSYFRIVKINNTIEFCVFGVSLDVHNFSSLNCCYCWALWRPTK